MRRAPWRYWAIVAAILLAYGALGVTVSSAAEAKLSPTTEPILQQSPATTQEASSEERVLRDTLYYLASDQLEGRGVGSEGLNRAADLIAHRFAMAGLRPLSGMASYFEPFTMTTAARVAPATRLHVNDVPLSPTEEFTPLPFSAEMDFAGDVVFVGYGVTDPAHHYDDYAGLDVKDKVVLAMRFEPCDEQGKSRLGPEGAYSSTATLISKANNAAAHGASAILLVTPPTYHGPDHLMGFGSQPIMQQEKLPVLNITQFAAKRLLDAPDLSKLKALQAEIDSKFAPASFAPAGVHAMGTVRFSRTTQTVKNVLAYLPGKGPLADEYVVVGAHYDHLGHGGPGSLAPGSTAIFSGADDNASGTDAVLALADRIGRSGLRERSILFACFTAEEWGLIGSQQFVTMAPVPMKQIVAMLNLDMVGRIRNETLYVGGNGTALPLDGVLDAARVGSPLIVKSIGRGGLGPSDHMSFAVKKVPVLFFFSGFHADYHRPTDHADKINYQGLDEVVDLSARVIDGLAKMPRSQYVDAADANSMLNNIGTSSSRVTLGVIPDYAAVDGTNGVRINGTVAASPAATAGLKEGDIITFFGEKQIDTLYDLSDALATAKPGQTVSLRVLRAGKTMNLTATLAERKVSP